MNAHTLSRRDVSLGDRVFSKVIWGGGPVTQVEVVPALQINAETLAEHQARMPREGLRTVSCVQAAAMGYSVGEILEWFA